jgi:hypothetical protein
MFHDVVVDISRSIYSELAEADEMDAENVEDCNEENDFDAEEIEEDFGGDEKEGFAADIEQDNDEVDSEEEEDYIGADVDDEGEADDSDGSDNEERIEDLETQLAQIKADFALLMSQEAEEEEHDLSDFDSLELDDEPEYGEEDEFEVDFDAENEDEDEVMEATKFQKEVNVDGKKSEKSADVKSPYTKAPAKTELGGKPVNFGKGDGQGKEADKTAKKEKSSDNVDVKNKETSADLKGEGKYSGTGKNSQRPTIQSKSPLSKRPK